MTPQIRILDTGLRSARWNVGMTRAMVVRHADGKAPDTVRFHRYRTCVLLGCGQRSIETVDVTHCRGVGIEIAHRITGGGAVYMSPRMLAWDVVVGRGGLGGDLGAATRRICEGVAEGLSSLGCDARFRPDNDIEIAGRKVSGSSGYAEGRSIILQGTILIDDEVPSMARALGIADTALRERVTSLSSALADVPSMATVTARVAGGVAAALGGVPAFHEIDPHEVEMADRFSREADSRADRVAEPPPALPERGAV